jgi:hypothetical protein
MQTHVKVLGVLLLVKAAFLALFAIGFPFFMRLIGGFAQQSGDPDAATGVAVLGLVGTGLGVYFGVGALVWGLTGYGVLKHQSWARIAAIVLSAISLIEIPIGTALGIYGLWIMFNKETEAIFAKPEHTS